MKAYRQGELLFIEITAELAKETRDQLLTGAVCKDNTIREGETTGHKHVAESGQLFTYSVPYGMNLPKGEMFLTSDNAIKIVHPEHKELDLPKGDYVIRIQREYNEERDSLVRD